MYIGIYLYFYVKKKKKKDFKQSDMGGPAVAPIPCSGFSNEISIPVFLEQIIFISIPVN